MNQPLYIVWKDSHNLNLPIIDEQHRGIVSTINSLYYFVCIGKGYDALLPTLRIIEQYTVLHFETEEQAMLESRYPALERHQRLHRELREKTRTILGVSALNHDPMQALHFLKDWWLTHISIEDRQFSDWLNKPNAVSKPPF